MPPEGKFVLSLLKLAHLISPVLTHLVLGLFDSDQELHHQFPWFSDLQTRPELHPGFQFFSLQTQIMELLGLSNHGSQLL